MVIPDGIHIIINNSNIKKNQSKTNGFRI